MKFGVNILISLYEFANITKVLNKSDNNNNTQSQ